MAQTTWKQVVLDTADAYREANGTTEKIPVGQLADKVRAGAGTPYEGDNPLTIGQAGFTFPAKTLLKDGLQIINGVNGEDLTDTAADQTTAVTELLKMVNRKIAMNNGEGQYVWKKLTAEGGEFIDFVVSSDAETYPDGATHADGYWYEIIDNYTGANPLTIGEAGATIPANTLLETALQIVNGVKAGIPLPSGYTKFAVDVFTPSSNTNIYQSGNPWKHSLGVTPKAIIVLGEPAKDSSVNAISRIIVDTVSTTSYAWVGIARLKNGYNNPSGSIVNLTNTTFNFQYNGNSSHYFASGVKYTIITMA